MYTIIEKVSDQCYLAEISGPMQSVQSPRCCVNPYRYLCWLYQEVYATKHCSALVSSIMFDLVAEWPTLFVVLALVTGSLW